jgi:hypothetical protein
MFGDTPVESKTQADGTVRHTLSRHAYESPASLSPSAQRSAWNSRESADTVPPPTAHADGKDWTYLVNLTANLGGSAQKKLEEMHDRLTGLTSDGRSQVIAMVRNQQTGALDIFRFADGKQELLGSKPIEGSARDIERLLSLAPTDGKVALINQSHGSDAAGIQGDQDVNPLTPGELAGAVRNGLSASGRTKLDTLSLDACLMGNSQALADLSPKDHPIADAIVASEVPEYPSQTGGGQEIVAALAAALNRPPANGTDFGRGLIHQSENACRSTRQQSENCGVETLAVYDSSKIPEFTRALSSFGEALSSALETPGNRDAMDKLIGDLQPLGDGLYHLRDLSAFAEGVVQAIGDGHGSIKDDPNFTLRSAASAVLATQREMIPASFDRDPQNHNVSVLLPPAGTKAETEFDKVTTALTAASHKLDDMVTSVQAGNGPDQRSIQDALLQTSTSLITDSAPLKQDGSAPQRPEQNVQAAIEKLLNQDGISANDLQQLAALTGNTLSRLQANKSAWIDQARRQASRRVEELLHERLGDMPLASVTGWEKFITRLRVYPQP